MRAVLPYAFTALHVPPNKTKASKTHLIGYVDAEVREVGRQDVDVVAQWITFSQDQRGQRRLCVTHGGDLYVEVAGWNNAPLLRLPSFPGDRVLDQVFGRDILGVGTLTKGEMDLLNRTFGAEPAPKSFQSLTAVVETNQKQNEAVARRCAESLLMIDGQVWRKVPWIGLELTQFPGGWKCDVAVGAVGFDDAGTDLSVFPYQSPGYVRRFALDEMERVRFHAQGDQLVIPIRELRSVNAPQTQSEEELLLRSARYAVRRTMEDVGNMPAEGVADWAALRAAYEAKVFTPEMPLPDDIAETLRRFTPTITHGRTREAMEEALDILEIYGAERQKRTVTPSAPRRRP